MLYAFIYMTFWKREIIGPKRDQWSVGLGAAAGVDQKRALAGTGTALYLPAFLKISHKCTPQGAEFVGCKFLKKCLRKKKKKKLHLLVNDGVILPLLLNLFVFPFFTLKGK